MHGHTKENDKNFSQDNRSLGRHLNPRPPEYETGALSNWPRISVQLNGNPSTPHIK
jgi:hypothetical protein